MTVILDPGNKPESYSDSARRQWQNTAGLWKTDYGNQTTNLANMTASRDYWQHTVAHNDPNVWDNRYNAGDAAGYARGYPDGQNSIIVGLNNPEGLLTAPLSLSSLTVNTTTGALATVTLNRTGHWHVGAQVDGQATLYTHGASLTVHVRGAISSDHITYGNNNTGTCTFHGGSASHGDWSSGQQIYVQISNQWLGPGGGVSISGLVWAHFIPNQTYHN